MVDNEPINYRRGGSSVRRIDSDAGGSSRTGWRPQVSELLVLVAILFDNYFLCRLESPTRSLHVQAAQRVKLEALAGEVAATSYHNLRLKSTGGSVSLIEYIP